MEENKGKYFGRSTNYSHVRDIGREHRTSVSLAGASIKVPDFTTGACLWGAFALAAVRVPELSLSVGGESTGADFADLALATVSVELLVALSAASSGKNALALSSSTVEGVACRVWAIFLGEFAVSGVWVEEFAWWALLGSSDLRASSSVEDVSWGSSFLVDALASALRGVEVLWV